MQNLSLDIIENLYRANDTFVVKGNEKSFNKRIEFQHKAMTDLKLLSYFSMLAVEEKCILPKQYEQISKYVEESQNLLGGWINSDRKRLQL